MREKPEQITTSTDTHVPPTTRAETPSRWLGGSMYTNVAGNTDPYTHAQNVTHHSTTHTSRGAADSHPNLEPKDTITPFNSYINCSKSQMGEDGQ